MKIFLTLLGTFFAVNAQSQFVSNQGPIINLNYNIQNSSPQPFRLTFKNIGSSVASLPSAIGNGAGVFRLAINRCVNVLPNKTCKISYAPPRDVAPANYVFNFGGIEVNYNVVNEDGNGISIPAPVAIESLELTQRILGPVQFSSGERTKNVNFTVKNTGNVSVIPEVRLSSNLGMRFLINRCSSSLAPNKTCSMSLSISAPPEAQEISRDLQVFIASSLKSSLSLLIKGPPVLIIQGCRNPNASNYNPAAVQDNGSCEFNTTYQWTFINEFSQLITVKGNISGYDNSMFTYGSTTTSFTYFNTKDNLFIFNEFGSEAPTTVQCNSGTNTTFTSPIVYNNDTSQWQALIDNSIYLNRSLELVNISCTFSGSQPVNRGCMHPSATNYDPNATIKENGSCEFNTTYQWLFTNEGPSDSFSIEGTRSMFLQITNGIASGISDYANQELAFILKDISGSSIPNMLQCRIVDNNNNISYQFDNPVVYNDSETRWQVIVDTLIYSNKSDRLDISCTFSGSQPK